jgi:hypothetical protein
MYAWKYRFKALPNCNPVTGQRYCVTSSFANWYEAWQAVQFSKISPIAAVKIVCVAPVWARSAMESQA